MSICAPDLDVSFLGHSSARKAPERALRFPASSSGHQAAREASLDWDRGDSTLASALSVQSGFMATHSHITGQRARNPTPASKVLHLND